MSILRFKSTEVTDVRIEHVLNQQGDWNAVISEINNILTHGGLTADLNDSTQFGKASRIGTYDDAIIATGTNQAAAYGLSKDVNKVAVAGSGSNGVRLPIPGIGRWVVTANHANFNVVIFPHVGGEINNRGAGTGLTVSDNTRQIFFATSATQWFMWHSTVT